ncbi:MAG: right-handed parallel beta-helix repeat-containing protein [Gemmatales bacterium]|nr:right-handed parallel beta-helix repeat-containing protein [Gemmatales bacterium]
MSRKLDLVLNSGHSLEDAVNRVPEGGVIQLQPGTYRLAQPLRIGKSLTIEGTDAHATIITSDAKGVVLAYEGGGQFRLGKVSVIHLGGQPANVFEAGSGTIEIEDCIFKGGVWSDEKKFGGVGLWLHGVVRGTVRRCLATANQLHGIEVSEHAQPVLEGNTCEGNQQSGIAYLENAGGTVRNNTCRGNGYHGLAVQGQAQPVLEGNTCEVNKATGIAYFENAGGTARNNICRGNGAAIAVGGKARPVLEGNTCERNQIAGIIYWDNSRGTALKNVCRGNGYHGIELDHQAQPALKENTCHANGESGIAFFDEAAGTAEKNYCVRNGQYGIILGSKATPMLSSNVCEGNPAGHIYRANSSESNTAKLFEELAQHLGMADETNGATEQGK